MKLFKMLCIAGLVVASAGCHRKGSMERAGEKVDNAAEKTGDSVRDSTETAGDKIEDATDKK